LEIHLLVAGPPGEVKGEVLIVAAPDETPEIQGAQPHLIKRRDLISDSEKNDRDNAREAC